ncbi:MAG: hypothetical protein H7222_00325 [Methylotenera sp.]|nr:hypothetical protein [Oligoflexia bacterium]
MNRTSFLTVVWLLVSGTGLSQISRADEMWLCDVKRAAAPEGVSLQKPTQFEISLPEPRVTLLHHYVQPDGSTSEVRQDLITLTTLGILHSNRGDCSASTESDPGAFYRFSYECEAVFGYLTFNFKTFTGSYLEVHTFPSELTEMLDLMRRSTLFDNCRLNVAR